MAYQFSQARLEKHNHSKASSVPKWEGSELFRSMNERSTGPKSLSKAAGASMSHESTVNDL
jgi:hypothetical protein